MVKVLQAFSTVVENVKKKSLCPTNIVLIIIVGDISWKGKFSIILFIVRMTQNNFPKPLEHFGMTITMGVNSFYLCL